MSEYKKFCWLDVEAFPVLNASVQVTLAETQAQLQHFKNLTSSKQISNTAYLNLIDYYKEQLDKVMFYESQVDKWLKSQKKDLKLIKLLNKVKVLKKSNQEIIELAECTIK